METLGDLIFIILFALIKIGDLIMWMVGIIKKTILYCIGLVISGIELLFRKLKKILNPSLSGTFIINGNNKNKEWLRSGLKKIIGYPLNVFKLILKAVGLLLRKVIFGLMWIFSRKRRGQKKLSHGKAKKYSAPFLYKVRLILIGVIISLIFVFFPLLGLIFLSELPNPNNLSVNYIPKTTKIYDRNNNLLYTIFANQNRTIVKLSEIPMFMRDATISIEDKDFYNHHGFDVRAILRAFISNMSNKEIQGGSTITQQLIKSAFFSPEPSITRKIKEVILAFWTEQVYSKDRILELYLNYVPYGGTAWGIQSASEIYFGKKVSELSLSEAAFLAGLPRAPSIYSPYSNGGGLWKKRQKEVLDAMVRNNYVTKEDAQKAYGEELTFKKLETPIKAPHFVMYIKDLLVQKYGINEVERGGLQVKTSLDLSIQEKAEQVVLEEVDKNAYLQIQNGAALITNPSNGDILAMVGSKNYFDSERDGNVNVTRALRQPGSTIKLITYTLALSDGFTEATILDDTPLTIYTQGGPPYAPVNYDGAFHGRIPLRTAFANSFNIPAVRTAQKLGVRNIVNFGREMGISSWKDANNYGVSITLGGGEVTMLDLATAYGTIANAGKRVDLSPILEVSDIDGKTLFRKETSEKRVVDEGVAFIISDILADNNARSFEFGSNSPLLIPGRRVSVKTGTTDNKRDNWTVGFTPNILVATWVGNNDNTPMSQFLASGITGAAPIWNRIMADLLAGPVSSPSSALLPENVVKKPCLGQDRYFIKGTENSLTCIIPTPTRSPEQL